MPTRASLPISSHFRGAVAAPRQIDAPGVKYLSRRPLQYPTHLHHAPPSINTGKKPALPQSLVETLFT